MCLIIHKPADKELDLDILRSGFYNNPDGFGIMHVDPTQEGVALFKKTTPSTFDEIQTVYEAVKDRELGIHFRLRTHGALNDEQAHPYQVLNRAQHGSDVFLMHNGILTVPTVDDSKSDTWHFVEHQFRPMLEANPRGHCTLALALGEFLDNPNFGRPAQPPAENQPPAEANKSAIPIAGTHGRTRQSPLLDGLVLVFTSSCRANCSTGQRTQTCAFCGVAGFLFTRVRVDGTGSDRQCERRSCQANRPWIFHKKDSPC